MTSGEDLHPLDAATGLISLGDGYEGRTSDAYWNLVGPFGGVTAAALLRAVLDSEGRRGDPAAITVNFCAPIAKGAFEIAAHSVRTNRTTQHWTVTLKQNEAVAATASVITAARPETWQCQLLIAPTAPPPDTLKSFAAGLSGWTDRYDFRFVEGEPELKAAPSDKALETKSVLWVADRPARKVDFISLCAMSDCFFARIFHARGALVPFGTVTMSTYFHIDASDLAAEEPAPLLGVADAAIFTRGFSNERAELWSAGGRLLATNSQLVYYRD